MNEAKCFVTVEKQRIKFFLMKGGIFCIILLIYQHDKLPQILESIALRQDKRRIEESRILDVFCHKNNKLKIA